MADSHTTGDQIDAGLSRARKRSIRTAGILGIAILFYLVLLFLGVLPSGHETPADHPEAIEVGHGSKTDYLPPAWAVLPFVTLLLAIAVLPLIAFTRRWWHYNRNRFLVAIILGIITLLFYGTMHPGGLQNHFSNASNSHSGWETIYAVFCNAILAEFIPFIVLLFSLYTISGGINLRGDLPARPDVNCAFLGIGTLLASFIGTTGAAMLLIRPLLSTNAERRYKVHTVIFFIFLACNCGGLLLPIGDPPLFLGYLRGVPFNWTLQLWPYWLAVNILLLLAFYVWDRIAYTREPIRAIVRDEAEIRPLKLSGKRNFILIFGVVMAVAFVVPGKPFPGTHFETPQFFREMLMLMLVMASLLATRPEVRFWNRFDYHAIIEVAALFSGIFLCMQVPIEILNAQGSSLGVNTPGAFFWATGLLSSFLDNAPTYVVFFETAAGMSSASMGQLLDISGGRVILERFLVPISLGAVFMGANTYIGNGPNFMVKSIAEQSGVKMPSFFGYMLYSLVILIPLFVVITFII
jgi:Na+/H+ antiporter NhaD/arsenite permease-like protein